MGGILLCIPCSYVILLSLLFLGFQVTSTGPLFDSRPASPVFVFFFSLRVIFPVLFNVLFSLFMGEEMFFFYFSYANWVEVPGRHGLFSCRDF